MLILLVLVRILPNACLLDRAHNAMRIALCVDVDGLGVVGVDRSAICGVLCALLGIERAIIKAPQYGQGCLFVFILHTQCGQGKKPSLGNSSMCRVLAC